MEYIKNSAGQTGLGKEVVLSSCDLDNPCIIDFCLFDHCLFDWF